MTKSGESVKLLCGRDWKMIKLLKFVTIAALMLSFAPSINAEECKTDLIEKYIAKGQELDISERKKILTEVAIEKGIPAEILKAMALVEGNGMRQFKTDGSPFITCDGGIGMMQLTLTEEEIANNEARVKRLIYDTRFNIEQGAEHLIEKWKNPNLPHVNNHEKDKIEDWYFAIMAYNGLSRTNDPKTAGGNHYQEKVFQYIRANSLLPIGETPELDIRYPDSDIMVFPEGTDYEWPTSTKTTQNYQVNEIAYTFNTFRDTSNLRSIITNAAGTGILHYSPVKIVGGPYETPDSTVNQYVFYKVKGTGFEGYMASSNLLTSERVTYFTDVKDYTMRAVTFLQSRNTINGFTDGTYRPARNLLRWEAAKLMVEALKLELPPGYKMKATDMTPGTPAYDYMLIAEANGIFTGAGGKLNPYKPLTRSEMAVVLVRTFEDVYENPPASFKYEGISTSHPKYEFINKLAHNGITVAQEYNPNDPTTRGHYALFLERSVKLKEAKEVFQN